MMWKSLELCSAVSEEVQTALYEAAQARGIGLISVGHRNSLRLPQLCYSLHLFWSGNSIPTSYNLMAPEDGV